MHIKTETTNQIARGLLIDCLGFAERRRGTILQSRQRAGARSGVERQKRHRLTEWAEDRIANRAPILPLPVVYSIQVCLRERRREGEKERKRERNYAHTCARVREYVGAHVHMCE